MCRFVVQAACACGRVHHAVATTATALIEVSPTIVCGHVLLDSDSVGADTPVANRANYRVRMQTRPADDPNALHLEFTPL